MSASEVVEEASNDAIVCVPAKFAAFSASSASSAPGLRPAAHAALLRLPTPLNGPRAAIEEE